ncbi:aspartate/glutamate racemase family protein [Paralcaligenes sp. KSB-10]|uniref:arylmalonate decarboxylase n=1 Tax=Paralcaligenes sp. KSB-10 TaxID=2901142 RepID=UPI001E4EAFAA|nr:aspartate/glutamate racemase family protein [Paralcaligenes sp. KSB-10]UHL63197.1 aspartate/glutamate racemase family protein [Paralcaligenes sp. KSB-10]
MMSFSFPDAQKPIGLIVPPAAGEVPPDARIMYPGLRFIAKGLSLGTVDKQGYDQVIDHVIEKARALADEGVSAISLMGTSLSFYRGADLNQRLKDQMEQATGLPCTTMSYAILRGMRALGLKTVAVATAYVDDVNQRLAAFLGVEGIAVASTKGLGINGVREVGQVSTDTLVSLCLEAWDDAKGNADGIVLSCGGLIVQDALKQVERQLDVPVVASSPAGFWDVVGTAGLDSRTQGCGRLAASAWLPSLG